MDKQAKVKPIIDTKQIGLSDLLEGIPRERQRKILEERALNDVMVFETLRLREKNNIDWETYLFWLVNMLLDKVTYIEKRDLQAEMTRVNSRIIIIK